MTQQAPKSFEDAFTEASMSAAEKQSLDPNADPDKPIRSSVKIEGAPDWLIIPSDLQIPPGREIRWMRFKPEWTDFPQKGERQCILWSLTDRDELQASKRARGDRERGLTELAKGSIRALDGYRADWTGEVGPGDVNRFWTEIGSRCRQMVLNDYFKTSALSAEEQDAFFQSCYGVARVTVG